MQVRKHESSCDSTSTSSETTITLWVDHDMTGTKGSMARLIVVEVLDEGSKRGERCKVDRVSSMVHIENF